MWLIDRRGGNKLYTTRIITRSNRLNDNHYHRYSTSHVRLPTAPNIHLSSRNVTLGRENFV